MDCISQRLSLAPRSGRVTIYVEGYRGQISFFLTFPLYRQSHHRTPSAPLFASKHVPLHRVSCRLVRFEDCQHWQQTSFSCIPSGLGQTTVHGTQSRCTVLPWFTRQRLLKNTILCPSPSNPPSFRSQLIYCPGISYLLQFEN